MEKVLQKQLGNALGEFGWNNAPFKTAIGELLKKFEEIGSNNALK